MSPNRPTDRPKTSGTNLVERIFIFIDDHRKAINFARVYYNKDRKKLIRSMFQSFCFSFYQFFFCKAFLSPFYFLSLGICDFSLTFLLLQQLRLIFLLFSVIVYFPLVRISHFLCLLLFIFRFKQFSPSCSLSYFLFLLMSFTRFWSSLFFLFLTLPFSFFLFLSLSCSSFLVLSLSCSFFLFCSPRLLKMHPISK